MPQRIVQIADCPYCETGEIFCDSHEAFPERLDELPGDEFLAGKDQQILIFNTDVSRSGPCGHLMHISGDIGSSDSRREGETVDKVFGWTAPILDEVDPDGFGRDYFWEELVFTDKAKGVTRPETPFLSHFLDRSWGTWNRENSPVKIDITGSVVFVKRIRKFFEELHDLEAARQDRLSKT